MATTPDEEKQLEGFFTNVKRGATAAVSHPRFRDTFVPAAGVFGVVAGASQNLALALGTSLLAFALVDKKR
jgi:hypothetical protein